MSFDTYIYVIISASGLSVFNLCAFGKVTFYYMVFCSFLHTPILHSLVYPYFNYFFLVLLAVIGFSLCM